MNFRLVWASSWLLEESQVEMQLLVSVERLMGEVLLAQIHLIIKNNTGHSNVQVQDNAGHQLLQSMRDGKIMMLSSLHVILRVDFANANRATWTRTMIGIMAVKQRSVQNSTVTHKLM